LQPIVWTGILVAAFQQLVGINVVKTYSTVLWSIVGFSTGAAFGISMLTVVISIIATVIAISIIDRFGRRRLLIAGAALMALSLGVLAVAFSMTTGSGDHVTLAHTPGIVALIAMNAFAVAFGITWGPVMWVMLSELFDGELRTSAVAVCTAVNWMTNWLVTRTFPVLAGAGLGLAYGLYAAFGVLALLFVWKSVPETSKRVIA
jgi:SP family sugar:H+ symporter-like MFS transporter